MKRGYFIDYLGNVVKVGFDKFGLPKEYFLLTGLLAEDCMVELPDSTIEIIQKVGFKFIYNEYK